ncbi:MAG: hypothetical protein NVSMB19_05690 [Vulcanimicrobiaceae bacterium]
MSKGVSAGGARRKRLTSPSDLVERPGVRAVESPSFDERMPPWVGRCAHPARRLAEADPKLAVPVPNLS